MSDPNYPDDIHQHDSDPRSPFYDSSAEDAEEEFMVDRVDTLMKDGQFVNEAMGEMELPMLAEMGAQAEKSMWVVSPHDSELWGRIGRTFQVFLYKYAEEQAKREWEVMGNE